MKLRNFALLCVLFAFLFPVFAQTQLVLNPIPAREVGHAQLQFPPTTFAPNLVEGRELSGPQTVAVDTSANPPILYVADTGNNRVLAWRDANGAPTGSFADAVIGQRDRFSTLAQGPGGISIGTARPVGLAVDAAGNLYVVDAGNNRILRFPNPMAQPDQQKTPDMVIGQVNFSSRQPNQGLNVAANGIATSNSSGSTVFQAAAAFDAQGNLWFTDAGNHRVVRYSKDSLNGNNPAADLVLGQPDFLTNKPLDANGANRNVRDRMNAPASLAFDSKGNLYVADSLARVLVFSPPFATGKPATRLMGIAPAVAQGQTPLPPVNPYTFGAAVLGTSPGVFAINDIPFVVDTFASRILRFDPLDRWAVETQTQISPDAKAAIGQDSPTSNVQTGAQLVALANRGRPEPASNSLALPSNAVFAAGTVWVADTGNNRVLALPDLSTGPAGTLGPPYEARRVLGQLGFEFNAVNLIEGREFNTPSDVAIDKRSDPPHLYVADAGNNRILGFRDARRVRPGDAADVVIGQPDFRRAVPNYPSGDPNKPTDSNMAAPTAIAVDSDGNLWVADTGNGRVLRFPTPFEQSQQRANLVLGQSSFTSKITDPSARTMAAPTGLAFTGDGHLLVADASHSRVLYFLKSNFTNGANADNVLGQPDFNTAGSGSATNRMNQPRHIAIDTDDRLYVSDSRNSRILIFNRVTVARAGADAAMVLENSTSAGSRLSVPIGVAVSQDTGEIWVTDTNNNRLLRYPRFIDLDPINANVADPQNVLQLVLQPQGIAFDGFGNLFVCDSANRVAIFFQALRSVNGANFSRGRQTDASGQRVVPGMVMSIFALGSDFATNTAVFDPNALPLPTTLADVQVLLNDQPVPLYFVSPRQINFLVPMSAPDSGPVSLMVMRPSAEQILAVGCTTVQTAGFNTADGSDDRFLCTDQLQADVASPALFTFGGGTGQVAALNQDNTVNSPQNPISRGQVLQIFGTGQGRVPNAPPDGMPAAGVTPTIDTPRVLVGTGFVPDANILYSGLAPDLIGVWQINVKIPDNVAPSNAVQVVVQYRDKLSNLQNPQTTQNPNGITTTIAVKQ